MLAGARSRGFRYFTLGRLIAGFCAFLLTVASVILAGGVAYATLGVNDYPSNLASAPKDSVVDPWGFYNRECTSFVAWRLNNDNGVAFKDRMTGPNGQVGTWGNAYQWSGNAVAIGYAFNGTPAAGSVAQWAPGRRKLIQAPLRPLPQAKADKPWRFHA